MLLCRRAAQAPARAILRRTRACAFSAAAPPPARTASRKPATAAGLPFAVVDAFCEDSQAYTGNPAAVCLLPPNARSIHGAGADAYDDWMLAVAEEAALSETAFLRPVEGKPNSFELRWWTPTVEVDLCGHATIASAHALWNLFGAAAPGAPISFSTHRYELQASRAEGDDGTGPVHLDFPQERIDEPLPRDSEDFRLAAEGLGLRPEQIVAAFRNRIDILVELDSQETLDALPRFVDFNTLARVSDYRVLIVTAPNAAALAAHESGAPRVAYDFSSRFFAPAFGVDEDPVCGSAHCCLGPYYQERFGGRAQFVGRAASHRGGTVHVGVGAAGGASADGRMKLGGTAVATQQGLLVGGLPELLFQPVGAAAAAAAE